MRSTGAPSPLQWAVGSEVAAREDLPRGPPGPLSDPAEAAEAPPPATSAPPSRGQLPICATMPSVGETVEVEYTMVAGPNQCFEGAVPIIRGRRWHSAPPFAATHRDSWYEAQRGGVGLRRRPRLGD